MWTFIPHAVEFISKIVLWFVSKGMIGLMFRKDHAGFAEENGLMGRTGNKGQPRGL